MKLNHLSQILFFLISLFLHLACGGATEDATEDIVDENTVDIQLRSNDNPLVPLAAKAEITTKKESKIKVTVMGRLPVETNFDSFSKSHQIPIVGLYPGQENKIQIEITDREGGVSRQDRTIQTLPIPDSALIPKIRVTENNLTENDHRFLLVDDGSKGSTYVIDHHGDVRWYLVDPSYILYTQLRNGNMIIAKGNIPNISYLYKTIAEIDMLGNVIKEYEIANYAHHAVMELPSGNLLVATNNKDDDETPDGQDLVIEIGRTTGEVVREYNLKELLPNMRPQAVKPKTNREDDWAHTNSISLNNEDQSLVFSLRNQSALINVTNGQYNNRRDVGWIIADPNCWNLGGKDLTSKLLRPASTATFPPSTQHSVRVLPNGNILIFDNGTNRGETYPEADCSSSAGASQNITHPNKLLEYSIDKEAGTYSLVWEYELDENHQSTSVGSVRQLASGNRLAYFPAFSSTGARSAIVEINQSKDTILKIEIFSRPYQSFLIDFD